MLDYGKEWAKEFEDGSRLRVVTLPDGTMVNFYEYPGGRGNWQEVFKPITFSMLFSDSEIKSETVELQEERMAIELDNRPIAKMEADRIRAELKRAMDSGLITLRRYKRWRSMMGLVDKDKMNDFHLTVLAGELYNIQRGGTFCGTPF